MVELGKHGRYRTNVWDYAGVNTFCSGRDAELEMRPTALPINAIRDCSRRGDIVPEAFSGSGTTIMAAREIEYPRRRCVVFARREGDKLRFRQYKGEVILAERDYWARD